MISYDYLEAVLTPLVRSEQMTQSDAAAIMRMRRQLRRNETMQPKPGYRTTELWLAVATAVISILIAYGVLSAEEAEAWQALAVAIVPLALSIASGAYSYSRAKVKAYSQ